MSSVIAFNAIKQADAGSMLHTAFGSVRTWSDFLADCIRDRTSFHGLQLHPVCYLRSSTGRAGRPLYDRQTVLDFIVAAHAGGALLV